MTIKCVFLKLLWSDNKYRRWMCKT